jgi:hypothetical protein
MALTREQRALFGGYSAETSDIRDALQRVIRDLKVKIITRDVELDVTKGVLSFDIVEDLDLPHLIGELKLLDNSAITSALPLVGQETVEIEFVRAGIKVKREFVCTGVINVEKTLNLAAGVTLLLTSKKQLTDSVSKFSRSYTGLASDIIKDIHNNSFKEEIDVQTPSSSAHNVVFPFTTPYGAIQNIIRKTFAADGTPYFLYENLFGKTPILKSLGDMNTETEFKDLFKLKKGVNRNKDARGQGTRHTPDHVGELYSASMTKDFDTLNLLRHGALLNNTIRLDISNKNYSENPFYYAKDAKLEGQSTLNSVDPYKNYEVNEDNMESNALNPSISIEMHNPFAFESEGVTELHTHADVLAKSKKKSYLSRLNNMVRITAMTDSDPMNLQIGKCVNLEIPMNAAALPGVDMTDQLFSGRYLITKIVHQVKVKDYIMQINLARMDLSKPRRSSGGGGK